MRVNELVFNVKDYGAVGDGVTDDTAAIRAAHSAAGAVRGVVWFPPGMYLCDSLVLAAAERVVTWRGAHGKSTRFGPNSKATSAVTLLQIAGSSNTLLTVDGGAAALENLMLDGNNRGGTGTLLAVSYGTETRVRDVYVVNSGGMGADIQSANNADWSRLHSYNCGSNDGNGTSTKPAIRICPTVSSTSRSVNTFSISMPNVEFAQGISIEIGTGTNIGTNYPEFLTLDRPHVESPTTYGDGIANAWPLVLIGNARNVDLMNPMLYGGPGECIQHDQTDTATGTALGGVRVFGGALLGRDAASGLQPDYLVRLKNGNYFSMEGTRVEQYGISAVYAKSNYGDFVSIGQTVQSSKPASTIFRDGRQGSRRPFYVSAAIVSPDSESKIAFGAQSAPFPPGKFYTVLGTTPSTFAMADGKLMGGFLTVGRSHTTAEIGIDVTTAGSAGALLRLGIFLVDKWNTGTFIRAMDAGTVDVTTTGYK